MSGPEAAPRPRRRGLKIAAGVLLALLALFCAVSAAGVSLAFDDMFARTAPSDDSLSLRYEDVADRYPRESVSFLSGENRLHGWLYGAGGPNGLIVFSHGMGGGGESYLPEGLYFVDRGYQVLLFDNTGCYESEGADCRGLSQSVLDLDAALTWVEAQDRFAGTPVFLWGHSWGGYAVAAVLGFDHRVAAAASVSGFDDPMAMVLDWAGDMLGGGLAAVERPFIILHEKIRFGSLLSLTASDALRETDTPALILHGSGDDVVGFDTVSIIARRDEIANPAVRFRVWDTPGQNGHSDLLHSPDAIAYRASPDASAHADRLRASAPNELLLGEILAFYRRNS